MNKIYILTICVLLFSGCSVTKPAITEYRLSLKEYDSKNYTSSCEEKSLKVSSAFSSNTLMTLDMRYMQSRHKIYSYRESQWNNSPNQEVSSQVLSAIRDAEIFKNVLNPKSRSRSDLILELNIEDFMQYYSDDLSSSYANVAICFTLIDASTNKSLATKSFSVKRDVESLDAVGGVRALNSALEEVITSGLEFLSGACR